MKWFLLLALATALPSEAFAFGKSRKSQVTSVQATFGEPEIVYGTGCQEGTVSASTAPDGSAVSFIYDDFQVTAGGSAGIPFARRTCKVRIPVEIPEGFQVVVSQSDVRGFVSLPLGARGHVAYQASLADRKSESRTRTRKKRFDDGTEDNFTWTDAAELVSRCGGSAILTVLTEASVQTNREGEEASIALDSSDLTTLDGRGVKAKLRKC